jgi:hypothetical protein
MFRSLLISGLLVGFVLFWRLLVYLATAYTQGTFTSAEFLLSVVGCLYVYGAVAFIARKKEQLFSEDDDSDSHGDQWEQLQWLRATRTPRH